MSDRKSGDRGALGRVVHVPLRALQRVPRRKPPDAADAGPGDSPDEPAAGRTPEEVWMEYGSSPLSLLAEILTYFYHHRRGETRSQLPVDVTRAGFVQNGVAPAALRLGLDPASTTRCLTDSFFSRGSPLEITRSLSLSGRRAVILAGAPVAAAAGSLAAPPPTMVARRWRQRPSAIMRSRTGKARLSRRPLSTPTTSGGRSAVATADWAVNYAAFRDPAAAVSWYFHFLLSTGSISVDTIRSDGAVVVDLYGDGKSGGFQSFGGLCYFFGAHFIQTSQPQALWSVLPLLINCGVSDKRATLVQVFNSAHFRAKLARLTTVRIPVDGVARDVPVVFRLKADLPGLAALCLHLGSPNGRYPIVPSCVKDKRAWRPKPDAAWFSMRPCPYCLAAHHEVYQPYHRLFDVARCLSPIIDVSDIVYGIFHGMTNAMTGLLADLCRALHRRHPGDDIVDWLVVLFRERRYGRDLPAVADAVADAERILGRRWDPLTPPPKGSRTSSLHHAEHTVVHKKCRDVRVQRHLLSALHRLGEVKAFDAMTDAFFVVNTMYDERRTAKLTPDELVAAQSAGRRVWSFWVRVGMFLHPSRGLQRELGCVLRPSGLGIGPSGHAFWCHLDRTMASRFRGGFENVGEHCLKRVSDVWSMLRLGNRRSTNRPLLLFVHVLCAVIVASRCDVSPSVLRSYAVVLGPAV
jgi:hypothetical protein